MACPKQRDSVADMDVPVRSAMLHSMRHLVAALRRHQV
jgi:hypothetical protein